MRYFKVLTIILKLFRESKCFEKAKANAKKPDANGNQPRQMTRTSISRCTSPPFCQQVSKRNERDTRNYSSEEAAELELFGETDPARAEAEDLAAVDPPALASGAERDGSSSVSWACSS